MSIRFGAAFFCEDVRHEASGKAMFIGTYTGEMTSPANPASVYLHLVIIWRADEAGESRVELTVDADDNRLADADFQLEAAGPGNIFSVFPLLAVEEISSDTNLIVRVRVDEGEWGVGYQTSIRVGATPSDPDPAAN